MYSFLDVYPPSAAFEMDRKPTTVRSWEQIPRGCYFQVDVDDPPGVVPEWKMANHADSFDAWAKGSVVGVNQVGRHNGKNVVGLVRVDGDLVRFFRPNSSFHTSRKVSSLTDFHVMWFTTDDVRNTLFS